MAASRATPAVMAKAPPMPAHLGEALDALDADLVFRDGFTDAFIDYFRHVKAAELRRFHAEVTDWEQREYFELF